MTVKNQKEELMMLTSGFRDLFFKTRSQNCTMLHVLNNCDMPFKRS